MLSLDEPHFPVVIGHNALGSDEPKILFVPLGIRELEAAVALERERTVPLEQQLEEYAVYRRSAARPRVSAEGMEVAKHFEEYALDRWNGSRRCQSAVCQGLWERFLDFVFRRLYRESLSDYEQAMKRRWIQEAAYFMWVNEGWVHGRHLQHWQAAERDYEDLERRLGMPPYEAERMKRYEGLQGRLS
jgi:hypothetical protein